MPVAGEAVAGRALVSRGHYHERPERLVGGVAAGDLVAIGFEQYQDAAQSVGQGMVVGVAPAAVLADGDDLPGQPIGRADGAGTGQWNLYFVVGEGGVDLRPVG